MYHDEIAARAHAPDSISFNALPPKRRAPSTIMSAPMLMMRPKEGTPSTACKDEADCLPADAVAWVENHPLPKSLSEINEGDSVLCEGAGVGVGMLRGAGESLF